MSKHVVHTAKVYPIFPALCNIHCMATPLNLLVTIDRLFLGNCASYTIKGYVTCIFLLSEYI